MNLSRPDPLSVRTAAALSRWPGCAAALAVVCALFFAPAFDPDAQFLFNDSGRMHFPMKSWIAGELSRGHVPQWNPYSGTGEPLIASGVDAVLHPLGGLLAALPIDAAFKGWVLLSVLAAGLGAGAWARRLGASGATPLLAGLAFMLTGFTVSYTDNLHYLSMVAAAPWLLAAGHAHATVGGPLRLAGVGAASLLLAMAGDPMGWGVAVGLASLQSWVTTSDRRVAPRRALALVAISVAASAPVNLPMWMWVPHSIRATALTQRELLAWSLAPTRLLELVIPGLSRGSAADLYNPIYEAIAPADPMLRPWVLSVYLGAPAAALAAFGGVRERLARALVLGAALFAWMAMGHYAGFGNLARLLPVAARFRYWEKLAVWPALLLAVAAALGAAALLADTRAAHRFAAFAGLGAVLYGALAGVAQVAPGWVGAVLGPGARGAGTREAIAANLARGGLHGALALAALALLSWSFARGSIRGSAPVLLAALLFGDLALAQRDAYVLSPTSIAKERVPLADAAMAEAHRPRVITPFDAPANAFPRLREVDAKARVQRRLLVETWNVAAGVGNFDGYTGLLPARAQAIRTALGPRGLLRQAGLWSFSLAVPPADAAAVVGAGGRAPVEVAGQDPEIPAWLVRIPSRPRAYLAREVASVDADGAFRFVQREPPESPRSVLEGPVPAVPATGGAARIVVDEGEEVVVEARVDGAGPALLVLSDQFAPGWTATVDGTPEEIRPANYLARGVWLRGGAHRVRFAYRTPGLAEGAAVLVLALAVLISWGLVRRWTIPGRQQPSA